MKAPAPGDGSAAVRWLRVDARWWILAGCALLIVLRAPGAFFDPSFFAEESTPYFRWAYHHTWLEALLHPRHVSFYMLVPNAATLIAANALPLEYAPFATLAAGTAVLLLLAVLVILPASPFDSPLRQALAVGLILLVPPSFGRLATIFSDFYLGIGTGIVLISGTGAGAPRWVRRVTLLVAGLTGVVSIFLLPLFALSARRSGARERWVQAAILGACAALQVAIFAHAFTGAWGEQNVRFVGIGFDMLAAAIFNQTWVHLFLGTPAMEAVGGFLERWVGAYYAGPGYYALFALVSVATAAPFVALVGVRRDSADQRVVLLLLGYALVAIPSFFLATPGYTGTKAALIAGHQRYFIAPNVFVALALLLRARPAGARAFRAAVAWMLAMGAFLFVFYTPAFLTEGPSWREQVARWRDDPSHRIAVWPHSWRPLELDAERPVESAGSR